MITRIQAKNYRCFADVDVALPAFSVLAGANGSGKTTLLDIPTLLGDMLSLGNVPSAFFTSSQPRGARATAVGELLHQGRGDGFSLAVEARCPAGVRVLGGDSHALVRYRVDFRVAKDRSLHVANETLSMAPDRGGAVQSDDDIYILQRSNGSETTLHYEVVAWGGLSLPQHRSAVQSDRLALGMVAFESALAFPVAHWMLDLLTSTTVFFDPEWSQLRRASPPGLPAMLMADGRNLPWLALTLLRDDPDRFETWTAHVRIALPQVTDIAVVEREDDHHAYFKVTYNGRYSVTSSGLSEGTLRILALTLLAYLPQSPALLVVEEPENGIHPRAIEAVLQGLSSMYDTQVLVSSHSPIVVSQTPIQQIIAGRVTSDGSVDFVAGPDHPRLADWKGEVDLGTLFAAGVLG